jgi:hypothetical protein
MASICCSPPDSVPAFEVALHVPFRARPGEARERAQQQVIKHAHGGEHAPPFRRMGQAAPGDAVRVQARDVLAVQRHLAGARLDHAGDGAHGGGLAGAVRADQGHQAALGHFERDAVQNLHLAVGRFQILNR